MRRPEKSRGSTRLTVSMKVQGAGIRMSIDVPEGFATARELLPVFRSVAGLLSDVAVGAAEKEGERVSCRKGCGACCRQLVPVAPAEALAVARLVEELPEPRRSDVRERFEEARRRLVDAALAGRLVENEGLTRAERREVGVAYFRLGIPCPFLEEESCSIHADRPIACREYLVTSPAEECARPTPETIRTVPVAASAWSALAIADVADVAEVVDVVEVAEAAVMAESPGPTRTTPWVPLSLVPEWAERHQHLDVRRSGKGLVEAFFRQLSSALSGSSAA